MSSVGVHRLTARVRSGLRWVVEAEPARGERAVRRKRRPAGRTIGTPRIRFWIAMGIVVAAISAAAGAWRAEIFTEYATQNEALARQDLTGMEMAERNDEQLLSAQFRQLGPYESDFLLGNLLQRHASRASGTAAAQLGAQSQNEYMLAAQQQADDFPQVSLTASYRNGRVAVDPTRTYALALLGDPALGTFDASDLSAKAQRSRRDAVDMAGVTVLFALTVVLLTLSEMLLRRKTIEPKFHWTTGHSVCVLAVVVWLSSAVLFTLPYLDVPRLQ